MQSVRPSLTSTSVPERLQERNLSGLRSVWSWRMYTSPAKGIWKVKEKRIWMPFLKGLFRYLASGRALGAAVGGVLRRKVAGLPRVYCDPRP